ncbi:MAG: Holliday junction branch migration protein RuvA [Planctomycetota bacterium]
MYDHIHGQVVRAQGTTAVLRAHGVGYEILVPVGDAAGLRVDATATLFTILHVSDGMPTLLGFAGQSERDLARRVLSVAGVGPKLALALLSTYPAARLVEVLRQEDLAALRRVKGVGAKTAERLCLELRDKLEEFTFEGAAGPEPTRGATKARAARLPDHAEDAVAALVTLGYGEKEARERIERALVSATDPSTETLVKSVLRG